MNKVIYSEILARSSLDRQFREAYERARKSNSIQILTLTEPNIRSVDQNAFYHKVIVREIAKGYGIPNIICHTYLKAMLLEVNPKGKSVLKDYEEISLAYSEFGQLDNIKDMPSTKYLDKLVFMEYCEICAYFGNATMDLQIPTEPMKMNIKELSEYIKR